VEAEAKIEKTKFIFPKKLIFVLFVIIFFVFASNKLAGKYMKKTPAKEQVKKIEYEYKTDKEGNKTLEKKQEGMICFGKDCK
jgi:hypothetical protein